MFDPSFSQKLSDFISNEIKAQFAKQATDTLKAFESAFQKIPDALKKAFDAGALRDIIKGMGDFSGTLGDVARKIQELERKMGFLDDQISLVEKLRAATRKLKKEEADLAKAMADAATNAADKATAMHLGEEAAKKHAKTLRDLLKLQKQMMAASTGLAEEHKQLSQVQDKMSLATLKNALVQKFLGVNMNTLRGSFRAFRRELLSIQGLLLGISLAVGIVVKALADAYRVLRQNGFDSYQAITNLGDVFGAQLRGLTQGVVVGTKEFALAYASVANSLGNVESPRQLTIDVTRLTKQYHVGNQEATRMGALLYRVSGYNDKIVRNQLIHTRALADANKIPINTVMQDMAANTEIMATYATRGVDAFARGLVVTRQMGSNIRSMSAFGDRLVNDFQSSLVMQAELQTILPNLDLSETIYAAQFGTEEQIAKSLKSALASTGMTSVDQLPRSLRNKVASSLGMSFEELQNIMSSKEPNVKSANLNNYSDTARSFGNSLGDLITATNAATAALGLLALEATHYLLTRPGSMLGGWLAKSGAAVGMKTLLGGGVIAGITAAVFRFISDKGKGVGAGRAAANSVGVGLFSGGGAIGGAALGAKIGTSVAGPMGTAVGGGLGAILGGLGGGKIGNMIMDRIGVKHHSGGIVGRSGSPMTLPTSTWMGAPRFHGGILPDEVPAILQRGEGVLTRAQLQQLASMMGTMRSIQGLMQGNIGGMMGSMRGLMQGNISGMMGMMQGNIGGMMGRGVGNIAGNLAHRAMGKVSGIGLRALGGIAGGPLGALAAPLLGKVGGKLLGKIGGLFGKKRGAVAGTPMSMGADSLIMDGSMGGLGAGVVSDGGSQEILSALQELIRVTKADKNISMDGKKLGKLLVEANRHSSD